MGFQGILIWDLNVLMELQYIITLWNIVKSQWVAGKENRMWWPLQKSMGARTQCDLEPIGCLKTGEDPPKTDQFNADNEYKVVPPR